MHQIGSKSETLLNLDFSLLVFSSLCWSVLKLRVDSDFYFVAQKLHFCSLSLWSTLDHVIVSWDSSIDFLLGSDVFPRDHFKSTFLSKISKPHPKHPWGNLVKSASREWIRKIFKFYHCHGLNCCFRYPVTIVSPKRNQPKALFLGF